MFGVAPKTIVEWQEQGLPIAKRGSAGIPSEYEADRCITWFVNREVERAAGESAKDRLSRLQGDKIERELQVMDRDLIPAAELEPALQRFFSDHCSEMDQVPEEYCDAIAAMAGDSIAVHQALSDLVRKLKDSCARYRFTVTVSSPVADRKGPAPDV